eukprot:GHUV01036211.1.p1 GENE.GHUV01036211.1~~GHUV01036211.1.p1  ORF type:complete len:103 (-),score=13.90 GHUV01036211.1:377-685(-)
MIQLVKVELCAHFVFSNDAIILGSLRLLVCFVVLHQSKPVYAHPFVITPIIPQLHFSQVPNSVATTSCELVRSVKHLASVLASKERQVERKAPVVVYSGSSI